MDTTPPPPPTHYCRWDAPGGLYVRALCGVLIRRVDHENEPTCPTCRVELTHIEERPEP